MVKINGKEIYADGMSVGEYVKKAGYSQDRTVVELNCQIVKKQKYDEVFLKDGDHLEVVNFVGGG